MKNHIVNTTILIALAGAAMMPNNAFSKEIIKSPNVAGQFYTADKDDLRAQIEGFLAAVPKDDHAVAPEIIIAPHAGYIYSGQTAAWAFKRIEGHTFSTVIVIAPSHHFPFSGAAIWGAGGFQTPLGTLKVNTDIAQTLIASSSLFTDNQQAFSREHALEVELPFLQVTLGNDTPIVPIIMGQNDPSSCKTMAESINAVMQKNPNILVVISSDMSHFHTDATAKTMDKMTLDLIKNMDVESFWVKCAKRELEMCGFIPVTTAMFLAKMRDLKPEIITYTNSSATTGDKSNVVGYGAVAFYSSKKPDNSAGTEAVESLSQEQKQTLLTLARNTMTAFVTNKRTFQSRTDDPRLNKHEGAFVTITRKGQLRGCIGHIIGTQPLHLTVRDMAIAAASKDPRFPPVTADELKDIDIEISVLSVPHRERNPENIIMGKHGVIIKRGWHQGVFLPQVATETGWSREIFLSQLCSQKAGLPADCWKDPGTEINIFTATVFGEKLDVSE